jgi:predicted nuclease of restriction endonuclease-like (RecB) superfamily
MNADGSDRVSGDDRELLGELGEMIEAARGRAAVAVNSELVLLYWSVGKRLREHVLGGERAAYGEAVVKRVAAELTARYGRGWSRRNLFNMIRFAEAYPKREIVQPLAAQLSWTNVAHLVAIADARERDFYMALAVRERWTKRTLRNQIDGKLYERTMAARGGRPGLEAEIAALRDTGAVIGLTFRDPYMLDFLGLPAKHSESDLEQAILDEMQRFLLELGAGFAFVARQKRITVDGEDYHLDLLLYHRGLRSLVAVELKTRKLRPADYGQMMLYLRWLDRHERGDGEAAPIGLVLCTQKGAEQVELLGMDTGEIRAAQYLTHDVREQMQRRLAGFKRENE